MNTAFESGIFVGLVVLTALVSYAVARWTLRRYCDEETRDLAGAVMFRIAGVHGLVLALVFAQDMLSVRDVSTGAAREATILSDIYHDAIRYDAVETVALQHHIARYGLLVVTTEWAQLAEMDRLSPEAWDEWESAYEILLSLEPASLRQDRLNEEMLKDVREISALRDAREDAAIGNDTSLFLWAAISGVALISAAFFTFPATALNVGLIASFSAYIGMILYMVITFSNPFSSPGHASTAGFERFLTPKVRAAAESIPNSG